MPGVGLGKWRMEKLSIHNLIHSVLCIGYCHMDCVADYQNEAEVADALAESFQSGLVKRKELRAFHHYLKPDSDPVNKHPELDKLLREELPTLGDFRTKPKACEAPEKETGAAAMQAAMHNKAEASYGQAR